jgi:hypothetical protein
MGCSGSWSPLPQILLSVTLRMYLTTVRRRLPPFRLPPFPQDRLCSLEVPLPDPHRGPGNACWNVSRSECRQMWTKQNKRQADIGTSVSTQETKRDRARQKRVFGLVARPSATRVSPTEAREAAWNYCCLLWIDKERAKDKRYIWVSVSWKTTN